MCRLFVKYMKHWKKKEMVRGLRENGLSYKEIMQSISFPIAKSTVSDWCKDIELTCEQKNRLEELFKCGSYRGSLLGAKTNQIRRLREVEAIKERARLEISELTQSELKLAGLMLYWAEGNKKYRVGISNSDPGIIHLMMEWFRKICNISDEKFKIYLNIHSGQDESRIKNFWSDVVGIPLSQFGKSYIKKEGTGYRKNILYKGTIKIEIGDKNLLYKILGWIEGVNFNKRATSSTGRANPS